MKKIIQNTLTGIVVLGTLLFTIVAIRVICDVLIKYNLANVGIMSVLGFYILVIAYVIGCSINYNN